MISLESTRVRIARLVGLLAFAQECDDKQKDAREEDQRRKAIKTCRFRNAGSQAMKRRDWKF